MSESGGPGEGKDAPAAARSGGCGAAAAEELAAAAAAITFLTVVPLPSPRRWRPALGARAVRHYPLAGLLVGVVIWLVVLGLLEPLGAAVTALLVVSVQALLSGGLHFDALADSGDALGSRRRGARAAAVMRDPRIGALGVLLLVLAVLGTWLLWSELLQRRGVTPWLLLIPVVTRTAMAAPLLLRPLTPGAGIFASLSAELGAGDVVWAAAVTLVLAGALAGMEAVLASLAVLAGAWLLALAFVRRLGGLNGDLVGSLQPLTELALLLLVGGAWL